MGDAEATHGPAARRLIRSRDHGALGTSLDGRPYVSLVATACDHDGSPLLLLSDLAQHTKNLLADPRVSLLFEDTGGRRSARRAAPYRARAGRSLRRQPPCRPLCRAPSLERRLCRVWRLSPLPGGRERGHLVAGFGRIAWVEGDELRVAADTAALAAAEGEIVAHLNTEHAAALTLCAQLLLGRHGDGWRMTGIDAEGLDLRREASWRGSISPRPW